jgi:hypothetical protein
MSGTLASYGLGVLGVAAAAAAWVGVQVAWRKTFSDVVSEPDALAGRTGCGVCSCTVDCEGRNAGRDGPAEESTP